MKKALIISVIGAIGALGVTACGTTTAPAQNASTAAPASTASTNATNSQPSTTSASALPTAYSMKMVTGKMDGKKGWPKTEPANLTLPENKDVTITLKNYDDGNATVPTGYNLVKGTVDGSIKVDGKTVTSIPMADVSHTITISSLGINIPIPVRTTSEKYVTVQFTIKTPATAQTLAWQCLAECGTGSAGWGGPMITSGWMKGNFTVQ